MILYIFPINGICRAWVKRVELPKMKGSIVLAPVSSWSHTCGFPNMFTYWEKTIHWLLSLNMKDKHIMDNAHPTVNAVCAFVGTPVLNLMGIWFNWYINCLVDIQVAPKLLMQEVTRNVLRVHMFTLLAPTH